MDPVITDATIGIYSNYGNGYPTWQIYSKNYTINNYIYHEIITFNTTTKNITEICIVPLDINYKFVFLSGYNL